MDLEAGNFEGGEWEGPTALIVQSGIVGRRLG